MSPIMVLPILRPFRFPALLLSLTVVAGTAATVDFGREVRPIVSDKCFHCHGPDESGRKGKLRLDTREGALREKNGSTVIVPGKSTDSDLVLRITSTDPEEMMPPPDAKIGRLTPAEVTILKRWIDEGAPFQNHWAFEPLAPVPTPATQIPDLKTQPTSFPSLSASPIDRLTFDGLARRKLAPQPDAALALTLAPGAYTVQLSSTDARPGEGLIEVYELP